MTDGQYNLLTNMHGDILHNFLAICQFAIKLKLTYISSTEVNKRCHSSDNSQSSEIVAITCSSLEANDDNSDSSRASCSYKEIKIHSLLSSGGKVFTNLVADNCESYCWSLSRFQQHEATRSITLPGCDTSPSQVAIYSWVAGRDPDRFPTFYRTRSDFFLSSRCPYMGIEPLQGLGRFFPQ